jgi:hypothetical protein
VTTLDLTVLSENSAERPRVIGVDTWKPSSYLDRDCSSQSIVEIGSLDSLSPSGLSLSRSSMAYHGRYPASSATARARDFPTPPQGTTSAATVAASDPISSESSPSRGASSLIPDMADLHSAHNRRLSPSSHGVAVPEGSAALFPHRSSSSSSPRARDLDHHHSYHHHHQGRSRGDGSVVVSRPSTLQRVASEFRRLARTSDVPPSVSEDDWSVFGEAMAHEGVQPQPPPHPSPGVASRTLVTTPFGRDGMRIHSQDAITHIGPSFRGLFSAGGGRR